MKHFHLFVGGNTWHNGQILQFSNRCLTSSARRAKEMIEGIFPASKEATANSQLQLLPLGPTQSSKAVGFAVSASGTLTLTQQWKLSPFSSLVLAHFKTSPPALQTALWDMVNVEEQFLVGIYTPELFQSTEDSDEEKATTNKRTLFNNVHQG